MIIAAIGNYEPFYFTKKNCDLPYQADICKKITTIALAIILALPCLLLDLICLPIWFLAQKLTPTQPQPRPPVVGQPPPPWQVPDIQPRVLTLEERLNRIQLIPHTAFNARQGNKIFFNQAIRSAFDLLDHQTTEIYRELIQNDGFLDNGDPAPIEIYKWSIECLVAHYLRCSYFEPDVIPAIYLVEQREALRPILNQYEALSPEENARVCLKIIDMNYQAELNENELALLHSIQGFAGNFTRNGPQLRAIWPPQP